MPTCFFISEDNPCIYREGEMCKSKTSGCGMQVVEKVPEKKGYVRQERWYEKYYRKREQMSPEEVQLWRNVSRNIQKREENVPFY